MKHIYKIFEFWTSLKKKQPAIIFNPRIEYYLQEAAKSYQASDYKTALICCDQVLSLENTNAAAYRIRGVVKHALLDTVGAQADLRQSLALRHV